MPPSSDKDAFRKALASAKNVIILSGAGISVRSGIPTYRGSQAAAWVQGGIRPYATLQEFKDNPSGAWQFYHPRRSLCLNAEPNDAHKALAALSLPSTASRIAPLSSPILHVTQNIDAISRRILDSLPPEIKTNDGKSLVETLYEIHGTLFVTRCTSCNDEQRNYAMSLTPSLELTKEGDTERDLSLDELPRCGGTAWKPGSNRKGNCGNLLRPNVVWFGEIPPLMGEITRKMNWCDFLLVVGTSLTVLPAAEFAPHVKRRGGNVAVFNLEPSKWDSEADFLFLGDCAETLPDALDVKDDICSLDRCE